ncbi:MULTISPECIES: glycosyltransferase [Cupriavidus]|uniref:glycosyltransferase n=1 Tax=Cupriavidus TaxID=106589 RepID=UPI001362DF23|nr:MULTISPECIES: glycosyltransferase [Cupriavidus]
MLFNPKSDDVHNVERVGGYFDRLVVVDNSQHPVDLDALSPHIHCIKNGNLGGIAGAFNAALDWFEKDLDLIFLLDQDSRITEDCVEKLVKAAATMESTSFIIGPAVFDVNLQKFAPLLNLTKWAYHSEEINPAESGLRRVFSVISSGSAISRAALERLGKFDETLVIDHVDTDYALRADEAGVPVFMCIDAVLDHAIGKRSEHHLLGLRLRPNNHAPFRRYYIFRNGLLLAFRHLRRRPSFFILNIARMVHELLCILFVEKNRMRKVSAAILGVFDGLFRRVGTFAEKWPALSKNL